MNIEEHIVKIHEDVREVKTDIKYIKEKLENGEITFSNHEKRLKKVEEGQASLTGKFAMIIVGIGAFITFLFNSILWVIDKINGH